MMSATNVTPIMRSQPKGVLRSTGSKQQPSQPATPQDKATQAKPVYKRPLAEIMADLAKPVPKRLLKTKVLKGNRINFVPWYNYVKLLNHYCPGWEIESEIGQAGGKTTVTAKLTIHAQECSVTRTGVGIENTDLDVFGDAVSNANAQALRKACALFGLTLDLWEK
ncbi:MAG: hypothetical protein HC851_18345 [Acaryochloris sp. RU_4_1]|nr:hypothetical protein [Acaryochloris sp. RU_4_1]NJR56673.1 hypothetical protein [Acaryochloris sp. CRU_2_0]